MGKIKVYSIMQENQNEKGRKIFETLQSVKVTGVLLETDKGYAHIENPTVSTSEDEDCDTWFCQAEVAGDINQYYMMIFRADLFLENGWMIELDVIDYEYEDKEEETLVCA